MQQVVQDTVAAIGRRPQQVLMDAGAILDKVDHGAKAQNQMVDMADVLVFIKSTVVIVLIIILRAAAAAAAAALALALVLALLLPLPVRLVLPEARRDDVAQRRGKIAHTGIRAKSRVVGDVEE